jgi:hypothetical protein
MRTLIATLIFAAGCAPSLTPIVTEPASAIAPGIYRIRSAAQCQDMAGSAWSLSTTYKGGCTAMVNLVACAPAPGGKCDCVGYPQDGGSGPGCDLIEGGGLAQDVEWR